MVVSIMAVRSDTSPDERTVRCSPADLEGTKLGLKDIHEGKVKSLSQVREELAI